MSDVAAAPAPATPAQKLKKKPAAKKPVNHPKYSEMAKEAIKVLKERGGSSRQAILKYIIKNFNVGNDEKAVNGHLKLALKAGVKNNNLKQAKGTGAAGSFRIGEKPAVVKKSPAKKPAAKKAAAKPKDKAAKPKKSPTKKPASAKKPKSPKKSPAKKSAVKAAKPKTIKKKASPKPKKAVVKKAAAKK